MTMEVWGVSKLKEPNSNHIIRKVIKRREQLLTREQSPKVIKELQYLETRMKIGHMLLDRWYETHLDKSQIEKQSISPALSSTRSQNRFDNRL